MNNSIIVPHEILALRKMTIEQLLAIDPETHVCFPRLIVVRDNSECPWLAWDGTLQNLGLELGTYEGEHTTIEIINHEDHYEVTGCIIKTAREFSQAAETALQGLAR